MAVIEHQHADAATSALALADTVARQLRAAIGARGSASLVVSGGRSPVPLFAALRVMPLDWAQVWITLADERWVEPDSPDSNERLLREHLLQDAAAAARFVALKSPFATVEQGLAASSASLAAIPRPYDVVVLGMGEDGHTASLFPGTTGLAAAMALDDPALLAAITPPSAPHRRITMRLPTLLAARVLHLPLAGAAKLAVYRQALQTGDASRWPIAAVLGQTRVPLSVWLA